MIWIFEKDFGPWNGTDYFIRVFSRLVFSAWILTLSLAVFKARTKIYSAMSYKPTIVIDNGTGYAF